MAVRKDGYTILDRDELLAFNKNMHRYHVRYGYIGCKRPKVSKGKRNLVFERDGGMCIYCGKKLSKDNFWIDHIKPLSRGGNNEIDNLGTSCPKCNLSKGTKTAEEFRGMNHDK